MMKLLPRRARKGDLWVDASKPFWWDLPMLVAAGQIDSIEMAHSHICRDTTINDEADGKPRNRKRYPSYKGDAEWSQEIYFRLLECGLRHSAHGRQRLGRVAEPRRLQPRLRPRRRRR